MFSKRVREARLSINKTQQEIADYVGISRTYLSMIENGRANMTFDLRVRLARMLGISPGYEEVDTGTKQELLLDKGTLFMELVRAYALHNFYEGVDAYGFAPIIASAATVPINILPDSAQELSTYAEDFVCFCVKKCLKPAWLDDSFLSG